MAAEPAYRLNIHSDFASEPSRMQGMHVERTGTRSEQEPSRLLVTMAKMAAILLVVIAALAFARIALTNATVTTMIESDSLSSQIEDARSSGIGLEMEQSVLSNTYAIDAAAARLGMSAPDSVATIALSPDVVAVDGDGVLSLSGSVKNLVKTQG